MQISTFTFPSGSLGITRPFLARSMSSVPPSQPYNGLTREASVFAAVNFALGSSSLLQRSPNPAVKRTYTGGANLFTRRASSAPVHAAYLRR